MSTQIQRIMMSDALSMRDAFKILTLDAPTDAFARAYIEKKLKSIEGAEFHVALRILEDTLTTLALYKQDAVLGDNDLCMPHHYEVH